MRPGLNLPGLAFLLLVIVLWQIAAELAPSPNLPGFIQVLGALVALRSTLVLELGHTLTRAAAGFGITLAVSLPLGIVLGRVRVIGDLITPVIELLRPLPPIAIIPVMMLFLGIGDAAKIAVVIYGASFPILVNTIDAVRSVDPMLSNVARSLRLTRGERMRLVDLPAALPRIVTGIRLSIGISLLLAVVAEMLLSTDGLGSFLMRAQESFAIANGLAGLVVIAVVALAANSTARAIERHLLAWHYARALGGQIGRPV